MLTWFIVGLFVGAFVGAAVSITCMGLAFAAKRGDAQVDAYKSAAYREIAQVQQRLGERAKKPVVG